MKSGKFPTGLHGQKRELLVTYLNELSTPKLQEDLWLNHLDTPNVSGIDEIFHFFFDDTDLSIDPYSEIDYILFDQNEAEAISILTKELDGILQKLGDAGSSSFLNDNNWPNIVKLAASALQLVNINELKRTKGSN